LFECRHSTNPLQLSHIAAKTRDVEKGKILTDVEEFLCIDSFAGRTDEDALFQTHSTSGERA
jgi:hypothetical protein